MAQAKGLGKGISALLEDDDEMMAANNDSGRGRDRVLSLEINLLHPGKYQPRRHFDEGALKELADSIATHGVMQPIAVREVGDNSYEIVAGERRWRASQLAGLKEVPTIVHELDDKQALELALIENIQRQDLNPIEEAQGYKRLMEEFDYKQEEMAAAVGKSRSHVANLLRLLQLPDEVKRLVDEEKISMGHARAVLSAENPLSLAREIIAEGLSVRQAEQRAKGAVAEAPSNVSEIPVPSKPRPVPTPKPSSQKDEDIIALEQTLSENIGLTVEINDQGQHGEVVIRYDSLEQLDDVLRRLGGVS